VLDTGDPHEAIDIVRRRNVPIDLLITDMVMAGMNGREVASRVRSLSPATRVLYMSGYTGDAMIHRGLLKPGAVFLVKPFSAAELLETVRRILERSPSEMV
jgi:CheY-like chemotaxis protein